MSVFTIQAPDGRKIKIEAGDEATAMRGAQEWAAANPLSSPPVTATEISEIEKVVRGSSVANLAKLFGKFGFGPGANGLGGFLGGSAGFTFGGPVGAAAFALGASGARKASEKLTENAANRAAKVVATPNIPVLPQRQPGTSLLAPALLPLELTRKREPIEITVRGGRP